MSILIILAAVIILTVAALIAEKLYVRKHPEARRRKARKAVLWTLRILFLSVLCWIGWFTYKVDYEEKELRTGSYGPYIVRTYQVGEPLFPFGPGRCRIRLYKEGKKIGQTDLWQSNDGKTTFPEDFDIVWGPEAVAVTVHGEEQEDATYLLYYDPLHPHRLKEPQVLHANFIDWYEDGCRVSVCDPMDNTVFPAGAKLSVNLEEGGKVIDLDGRMETYETDHSLFKVPIGKKFRWSEGMVLEITFSAYADYKAEDGYQNRALAGQIENVDVISIDVD